MAKNETLEVEGKVITIEGNVCDAGASITVGYKYYKEIESGKRSPYCASIHDEESIKNHYYDKERAEQVFRYYIDNAN